MAWSPGAGCLTSPASLAIGCELSSRNSSSTGGSAPRCLAPSLRAFCSCHCSRAAGLPPSSQLAAPGKRLGAAKGSWRSSAGRPGEWAGQTQRPEPHPWSQLRPPARPSRRLAAPQCNSLQLPLESGKGSAACCGFTWSWSQARFLGP